MSSKKTPQQKRARPPRNADRTKAFARDWERLSHSGRYNMRHLKEVMILLIANDEPLPAEYLDHELTGEWANFRECHIGGNFLLIYELREPTVIFTRAGTHSELF